MAADQTTPKWEEEYDCLTPNCGQKCCYSLVDQHQFGVTPPPICPYGDKHQEGFSPQWKIRKLTVTSIDTQQPSKESLEVIQAYQIYCYCPDKKANVTEGVCKACQKCRNTRTLSQPPTKPSSSLDGWVQVKKEKKK
jgi:hypothetical protein